MIIVTKPFITLMVMLLALASFSINGVANKENILDELGVKIKKNFRFKFHRRFFQNMDSDELDTILDNKIVVDQKICPYVIEDIRESLLKKYPNWQNQKDKFLPLATKLMGKCEHRLGADDEDVSHISHNFMKSGYIIFHLFELFHNKELHNLKIFENSKK